MAKVTMGDKEPRCARDEMRECTRDQESVGGPADSKAREQPAAGWDAMLESSSSQGGKESSPEGGICGRHGPNKNGLDGDETGDGNGPHGSTGNGTGAGEGEGEKRQTSLEIEIDDMAMEMGRASPSMTALSPARIESRPPRLLMVRSVHLSSLPSFLSHFPLHSFIRGRPPSLDLDGCRANPVIPPPGEMRGVPTLPTQPTPPHPTAAMLGGRALGCLRFCFDVLHDLRQKEQHNTPLPSG